MKHKLTLGLLALLAGGPSLSRAQAPALATFQVGTTTVTASEVANSLGIVWELAWGPDNFIWMTERQGRISRLNPATGQVLPLLTLPDVTPVGESGLLGMVLHPQFATSPYVYLVYNYTEAGTLKEKLVRYTYAPAAGTLSSPLVLLGNITATTTHSGSRLLILPDLTLLMTTGDAQIRPDAQNMTSLNGKILRLNLDGSIPANNPTPGSPVYTLGHRNPQGLTLGPGGRIYSSEHGNSTDDEINLIEPGRNYGWPTVEGYCNLPAEAAFCTPNNVREPLVAWTPTIAPSGLTYYDHPAIPGWRGSLLLAVLKDQVLVQLPLNAAGTGITSPAYFMRGTFGRLRSLCVSPQGKVYVGTSSSTGGNRNDRVLVLENRSYVTATTPTASLDFRLWPNPAQRQLTIALPAGPARLTIRDALGRSVLSQQTTTATTTLELAALQPGYYTIQAQHATGSSIRRLVVE
ncbi:PQQ-dependent sugar dehydrogenase [Hymenobacter sp. ASUV-10]|uniref:PQQ-dependent sugar dehydrogenase n=1 Tax=Hymenobacter aranciens TaxID=3063996 RepID=A0ABT9BC32_9BACT|nr:PQQ-dependent sugar dehydrogenase [Hymenobacter sp. ASUV-10]MDO7874587.1 PQQ-dependent sugar dehydrogenase [Hymenobacter sp. ASUV-10]